MAVLVAYDGSEPARKAVEYAFDTHADEEIVLFRVVEAAEGTAEAGFNLLQDALEDSENEAEAEEENPFEGATTEIDTEGAEFRTETAVGKPDREIVDYAEEEANGIDRIVVGSHGRDGVSRILLGSVAERIVRRAPVPVTIVR